MGSDLDFLKGLEHLNEIEFPTYYSPGAKERALELAEIATNCVHYLDEFYENKVQNRLLVLNEEDWTQRIEFPYGLIAGRKNYLWYPTVKNDNPVFQEMVPYYENSPDGLRQELDKLLNSRSSPYLYALLRWWEVLMVHEYTHNYNRENGVAIKLNWFDELFCDYFTYAYLKRYEKTNPVDLGLFELVSKIMYFGGYDVVKHRSIEDFEKLYTRVGAANYCWYHGWFNIGVISLFEVYGEGFIEKVIGLYQSEPGFDSSSDELVRRLNRDLVGFQDWYDDWIIQEA
ncbi:MAG: hypothetical protein NWE89_10335 [Candidatus Bathyarchaeota archaeon]|nr:hypothetical protein [Candidatus Bathyarchaeota archaeon]